MLYAIEWIRVQLTGIYNFVSGLLESLTLESIGTFLTRSPALLVLYILAGLALTLVGFKFHKLVNSLIGGAVMGYLGWQIGTAINSDFISSSILWMLVFAIIGLFVFYFLFVINVGIGAFLLSFTVFRTLSAFDIKTCVIAGVVFMAIFCVLLIRRHFIRTPVTGGALLGLIAFHYFVNIAALVIFLACIGGGTILQGFLSKQYEKKELIEYKPNAPVPPTPEEIAAQIAEEEPEKAEKPEEPIKQDGDTYAVI